MTRIEWAMNMAADEHFKAVMQELREAEVQKFATSAPLDIEVREDAYRRIRFYDDLEAHIESLAMTATVKEKRWKIL